MSKNRVISGKAPLAILHHLGRRKLLGLLGSCINPRFHPLPDGIVNIGGVSIVTLLQRIVYYFYAFKSMRCLVFRILFRSLGSAAVWRECHRDPARAE